MKKIHAPHLGRDVSFGRKRPAAPKLGEKRLHLRDYLARGASLPTPPASVDYSVKGAAALSNVFENDALGCCVISGLYHVLGVATGNASGTPFIATDAQILADYGAIGGYNPADPSTDQGCDEVTALNYWRDTGCADGSKLAGYALIDQSNLQELQIALWLFGNLYYGFELPDAWTATMPSDSNFTWDAAGAPDPNQGHCVMSASYNGPTFGVGTWGLYGALTGAAIAEYGAPANGGAVYAILTPDWIAQGQTLAPSGVDWASLQADLAALAPPAAAA